MTSAIDSVIKRLRDLPPMPSLVLELQAMMAQEDVDLQALARTISLDQALAAKTLRLANSSFYGMSTNVASIGQAIGLLGLRSIHSLVVACSVIGRLPPQGAAVDMNRFWQHAVGTAACSRLVAARLGTDHETAFIAGLLHDVGKLVLAICLPQQWAAVLDHCQQQESTMEQAELAVLGFGHTDVGSALAAYWQFPAAIQDAIAGHHRLDEGGHLLAHVVQAADSIVHGLDLCGPDDDMAPPMPHHVWKALALSEADSIALFHETERSFDEMCHILLN